MEVLEKARFLIHLIYDKILFCLDKRERVLIIEKINIIHSFSQMEPYRASIKSQHNSLWTWAHHFGFADDARILAWVIADSVERLVARWSSAKELITIGDNERWVNWGELYAGIESHWTSMSELLILDIRASLRNLWDNKPNTLRFDDFFRDYPFMDFSSKYAFWIQLYWEAPNWFLGEWWDTDNYLLKIGYEYFARKDLALYMSTTYQPHQWSIMPGRPNTPIISARGDEVRIPQPVWNKTMAKLFE